MKKIVFYSLLSFIIPGMANAADVVARPTTVTTPRARPVSATSVRASTALTTTAAAEEVTAEETTDEIITETQTIDSDRINKFSNALDGQSAAVTESDLKSLINAQRNADQIATTLSTTVKTATTKTIGGRSLCDESLRLCMQEKCGDNFENCALDTDLQWGEKIESCRLTAKCTGAEYAAFAPEIKADRDAYQLMGDFVLVQSCGAEYNECIVSGCGTQFDKCLGKAAGDKIISDCSQIAEKCRTADSGLAARAMRVLGTLRQDAEKQVVTDEAKLYTLREEMANKCKGLGAMFDSRSMNCVFTVEMFAPSSENSLASKKVSAGNSFDCTQEWFGVDVTTYKEDAARLTREQKAATSALMGAGVGTLGGIGVNKVAPSIGAGKIGAGE